MSTNKLFAALAKSIRTKVYDDEGVKWYLNDKLHKTNGPAVIYFNGNEAWFLNGIEYTEEQHNEKMKEQNKA